jgi:hypothetical protein
MRLTALDARDVLAPAVLDVLPHVLQTVPDHVQRQDVLLDVVENVPGVHVRQAAATEDVRPRAVTCAMDFSLEPDAVVDATTPALDHVAVDVDQPVPVLPAPTLVQEHAHCLLAQAPAARTALQTASQTATPVAAFLVPLAVPTRHVMALMPCHSKGANMDITIQQTADGTLHIENWSSLDQTIRDFLVEGLRLIYKDVKGTNQFVQNVTFTADGTVTIAKE